MTHQNCAGNRKDCNNLIPYTCAYRNTTRQSRTHHVATLPITVTAVVDPVNMGNKESQRPHGSKSETIASLFSSLTPSDSRSLTRSC